MALFAGQVEQDNRSAMRVVVLRYCNPAQPGSDLEARIAPAAGSNLFSLRRRNIELLHQPEQLGLPALYYGFPILFPTPNRVKDSRFTFKGRTFQFLPNERSHFIHGLVHSAQWEFADPVVRENSVSVQTFLNWTPEREDFSRFPLVHRLEMTFSLESDGVRLTYTVINHDQSPLPFGIGFHPYFQILGDRSETFLEVPAQAVMESVGLLPTGRLNKLGGSLYDLREPVSLETLNLDDVYSGMVSERPASYESRHARLRVRLKASAEFTHMVVYTPPGKSFFCMENQTCSTDAHNLFSRGLFEEAHLLIASPTQSLSGWVHVRIEDR
jgi:aldose 1-epimerase